MDNISIILSSLLSAALILWLAPPVFRMNKGRVLQNIALWLAIACVLGLAYKTIGPGRTQYASPATEITSDAPADANIDARVSE
ncbi:MAG: hypothetical protein AB7S81_03370 [Bdellovibrionales bacterium]